MMADGESKKNQNESYLMKQILISCSCVVMYASLPLANDCYSEMLTKFNKRQSLRPPKSLGVWILCAFALSPPNAWHVEALRIIYSDYTSLREIGSLLVASIPKNRTGAAGSYRDCRSLR
jgi:hypothetical protein